MLEAVCSAVIAAFATLFLNNSVGTATESLNPVKNRELLETTVSPDGGYTVNVYLVSDGGATVAHSVQAFVEQDSEEKLIYNVYKEHHSETHWINGSIVNINGIALDLAKYDTYDWRWGHNVAYSIFVKPFKTLFSHKY